MRKVYKDISFYYLDEKNIYATKITNNLLKWLDSNIKFIHLATTNSSRDINLKDVNDYNNYDYLWIDMLDYNNSNNDFINFINKRKKVNLYTFKYSLDSDWTFSLVRSEPKTNMYIYQGLANEGVDYKGAGSQYYLRYLVNDWYSGNSYYSSDFYDFKWVDDI